VPQQTIPHYYWCYNSHTQNSLPADKLTEMNDNYIFSPGINVLKLNIQMIYYQMKSAKRKLKIKLLLFLDFNVEVG
jgi:hypothetical protein